MMNEENKGQKPKAKGQRLRARGQRFGKVWVWVLLIGLCSFSVNAQELVRVVEGSWSGVSVDPMGNFYVRSHDLMIKYSPEGDSLYRYTQPVLGDIRSVDVSNPFRILVYHADINTLVFLDKTLSPFNDPVSLDLLGHPQTGAVCSSSQGGFWLFDPVNHKLYRYDSDLGPVIEAQTRLPKEKEPAGSIPLIREADNKVWISSSRTTQIYDLFGSFLTQIPVSQSNRQTMEMIRDLPFTGTAEETEYSNKSLIIRTSERCYLFIR